MATGCSISFNFKMAHGERWCPLVLKTHLYKLLYTHIAHSRGVRMLYNCELHVVIEHLGRNDTRKSAWMYSLLRTIQLHNISSFQKTLNNEKTPK